MQIHSYIDATQPNFSSDSNGPSEAFGVWCALEYVLLGTAPHKSDGQTAAPSKVCILALDIIVSSA